METTLYLLLDHLSQEPPTQPLTWRNWQITPIQGGWNNLLYRATSPIGDFAIKFTVRDERDRAGREYNALLALQQAGLALAPLPVLLDRSRYRQPVVVQTWLGGEVSTLLPDNDAEWLCLLQHLIAVHAITPARTMAPLLPAVLNANHASEMVDLVRQQLRYIPLKEQPEALQMLFQRLLLTPFSAWPTPPVVLCRVDCQLGNFVRYPGKWSSVDWENSGWGDPAFEIADLTMHMAHTDVAATRWQWLTQTYCTLVQDEQAALRIETYRKIKAVWYVARLYRYLYEWPRGLDQRLISLPPDWQRDIQAKYDHYLVMSINLFT